VNNPPRRPLPARTRVDRSATASREAVIVCFISLSKAREGWPVTRNGRHDTATRFIRYNLHVSSAIEAYPGTRLVAAAACLALAFSIGERPMPAQAVAAVQVVDGPADRPAPRTDENSSIAHAQLLEKAAKGGIAIYFVGDSIVRRWGATDYPELLANWRENFWGWNAADFGWGADKTQHILWRLEHGELDGVHPRVIVILAGTNNVGAQAGGAGKVAEITRGLEAILKICRQKAPAAMIVLTAIFPRNDNMAVVPEIDRINANLARMADGRSVRFLSVNHRLADAHGRLLDGMMNPRDQLHPTVKGYQVWADALKPIFTELLGPPAATDHAPPPTGDPSARGRSGRR
jgi:lysophospholipase L1-like esterase